MTRLDDLLGYDVPARRRTRSTANRLTRNAIGAALISVAVVYAVRLAGGDLPYLMVFVTTFSFVLLFEILRRLRPPELPHVLRNAPESRYIRPPIEYDGCYRAVRRWAARLEWTEDDVRRFATIVQPAMVDIADERLRLRHSIIRAKDPERARALCGPQLWQFLTVPVTRPLHPHEIATVVAQMEAL